MPRALGQLQARRLRGPAGLREHGRPVHPPTMRPFGAPAMTCAKNLRHQVAGDGAPNASAMDIALRAWVRPAIRQSRS